MTLRFHQILICITVLFLCSCTSARWTVKDKSAIDKSDYEVLDRKRFLMKSGEVSPDSPYLRLSVMSRTKYEYPQRVLVQRNMQDYQLRPGYLAVSLTGAALAFLAANSTFLIGKKTKTRVWTLNAAGALIAASGFLNMKPVGEPRPTGEQRLLKKSGSVIQTDTAKVSDVTDEIVDITIQYGDISIYEDSSRSISDQLEIPLAEHLSDLQLTGPNPGNVSVQINYRDSIYTYQYPVSNVLQPYARITARITSLRNSPSEGGENTVADLAEGSQLPISSVYNEDWYKVMYGISEHYIPRDEAEMVWRTSDFAQKNEVVTIPRVPFGDIDVESNIPILRSSKKNALALIITNEDYDGNLPKRTYAHRDGRLIKSYLRNALGYFPSNIYELEDVKSDNSINRLLNQMKSAANDSTELTVYLSGYGSIDEKENNELNFLGVSGEQETQAKISLRQLFEKLGSITSGQTLVLNDIDFSHSVSKGYSAIRARRIMEQNTDALTSSNSRAVVLYSTHLNQPTSLFMAPGGEDKKHHIFPYFLAKALQLRRTHISSIYQYLERNVSYTARKLHDRPQDPLLIGSTLMNLQDE